MPELIYSKDEVDNLFTEFKTGTGNVLNQIGSDIVTLSEDLQKVKAQMDALTKPPGKPFETDFSKIHGVNWNSSIMKWSEGQAVAPTSSINTAEIDKFMDICLVNGWNMIRLVVYQECYVGHKQQFVAELIKTLDSATERGIGVLIDNHQWRIGGGAYTDSQGVPKKYLQGYTITGIPKSYDQADVAPDAVKWWQDFYTNQLRGFPEVQGDFEDYLVSLVDICDNYDNVLGYEILNEPQTTRLEDYVEMGKFNTRMAKAIRARSQKDIYYCRDNSIGALWQPRNIERPKLIPKDVTGLVYDNHSYSLQRMKNTFVAENKTAIANRSDIKTMIGEFAHQIQFDPTNIQTPENTRLVLALARSAGYAIAWWALGLFGAGDWKRLANADGTLRLEGTTYAEQIKVVYA